MKLYATIYDFSFQPYIDSAHARLDFYARLDNGQIIFLAETGPAKDLSKKFEFSISQGSEDFTGFKNRPCELIQDSHGIRFGKFTGSRVMANF